MTTLADPARRPAARAATVALLCTAQFVVVLDATIVAIALPAIRGSLHMATADLQWVLSAYTLAFAGFLVLAGRLADLHGRRRVFMAGLTLFSVASLACGLSTSPAMLIAARPVQGLGAAAVAPAALAAITAAIPDGPARRRALGVWTAAAAGGGGAGWLRGGGARPASGPRRPPAVAPRAGCWAACSPSRPAGHGCSSSTCRSASRPSRSRRCSCARRRPADRGGGSTSRARRR